MIPDSQMEFDFNAAAEAAESAAPELVRNDDAAAQPMLNLKGADEVQDDGPDAISEWRKEYAERLREVASELGLPIGKRVRLELKNGAGTTGVLELDTNAREAKLHRKDDVPLRLRSLHFSWREVVSCVRV